MKRVVDVLYGMKGYPNAERFAEFKADLFGDYSANEDAVVNVPTATYRAISVGTKGTTYANSTSLPITSIGGTLDTEPANNYLVGVFSKVSTSETTTSTDDLGSAWFRTRVDKDVHIGAGYSLWGTRSQLRIYGDSGGTNIANWAAAGILGVLEVSGATTTFASGAVAAAGYFNVALTTTSVIASGAVVAAVVANSGSAAITDTGVAYYGYYVGMTGAVAFDAGLKIASGTCKTGVDVTIATLPVGDAYSGIRSVVSAAAPNNSYGAAGYFETNTTGTYGSNFMYGLGSWVNVISGAAKSGGYIAAQDNGIYYVAGTLTGARVIFGLRAEVPVSMAAAGRVCPFSVNTNNVAITALFDVPNIGDLGSASGKSTTNTYLPILIDDAGAIRYVLLYS
jgi:hypothetical protein